MTWPPPTPDGPAYIYEAECVRVIDGDTFIASVSLGFTVSVQISVRIHGVNAPEHNTPEGPAATEFLREQLYTQGGQPEPLLLSSLRGDRSFARWVCDVWTGERTLLAENIIAAGHGVPMRQ